MIAYRARDGDTLDWICWRHYARASVVPQVLEANPGLADLGPRLPAGTLVVLPADIEVPPTDPPIQIWD